MFITAGESGFLSDHGTTQMNDTRYRTALVGLAVALSVTSWPVAGQIHEAGREQDPMGRREFLTVEQVVLRSIGDKKWAANIPGDKDVYRFKETARTKDYIELMCTTQNHNYVRIF
jgi:hypothetical protein